MFDICLYLKEKENQIFTAGNAKCRFVITKQKNTGDIYFCKKLSPNGEAIETIVLKHYHNSETPFLEYSFATQYESSFKQQEHIRIPSYVYFDRENKIVATKLVENSVTLEKYLLTNRTVFGNKIDTHWFQLAGKWLAHFHKVSSSPKQETINGRYVANDLRRKWLLCFPEPQKIETEFIRLADSVGVHQCVPSVFSKMHREYGPGNILLSGTDLYGIDFGNQETAPPYDDISYFIIACITLNQFPRYPSYKKVVFTSEELKVFINGYLEHYPFTQADLFSDRLFILFLWKNLIRRMSGKLTKANYYPPLLRDIARSYLIDRYLQIQGELLHFW